MMFSTFEGVINYYRENLNLLNPSNLSDRNLNPIKKWLEHQLRLKKGKDNNESTAIRKQGNIFYKEKAIEKSFECYNSSICCAEELSEEYFLALANRSATTFELKKYEDCLKDIEICLNSHTYPENLKHKLHIRKEECLKRTVPGPISLEQSGNSLPQNLMKNKNVYKLPSLEEGENPNFAYASSKIGIRYNEHKGRHVVAKQDIKKGDVLFVEKAFAFAPLFDEHSRELNILKCYDCLENTYSGVPCKFCEKCIFCNLKCRDKSWEESHRWECRGMVGDIWYHLGIAFPAFRSLLKGCEITFREIEINQIQAFGNRENNYPFFNSLVYDKNNKHLDVSIMSITVLTYLKEYTNYFDWFLSRPKNVNWSKERLETFIEVQLMKHILQFQNNSSIIEHWIEGEILPSEKEPVACGIFPSVSIMNHSCKPNITNYFVCDTIVVKALEDIGKDGEIFNCYGIYYRDMKKIDRQQNCAQLYHFQCNCVICSDPDKEMDAHDHFICKNCSFDIPKGLKLNSTFCCENCGFNLNYRDLIEIYQNIELEENENDEQSLLISLKHKKKILNKFHSSLQRAYFKLYQFYKEIGNYENMLEYFEKWFNVEKVKVGQDVQLFGALLYEVSLVLISNKNKIENQKTFTKAKEFMSDAIHICELHYPPYIIDIIKIGRNSKVT